MDGSLDDIEGIEHSEETPDKVIEIYEHEMSRKNKWIKALFITLIVVFGALIIILFIDVLNGSIGFVRY